MAWTAPKTWVTDEVVTAGDMNTHVRDNLNDLNDRVSDTIENVGNDLVATNETTTSTTYTDLTTSGPSVTVTTGTTVLVVISSTMRCTSAGAGGMYASVAVSGATTIAAVDTRALLFEPASAGEYWKASFIAFIATLTAGSNTFTLKYRTVSGITAEFSNREITVIPLG